ncbi:hypothetical protein F8R89_24370 [Streptomyces sp. SS1-1]|nr:hypothetical protein DC008_24275 [Streptomyces nigra]KAB2974852.1 hypothetical protein F8R89_24370 [Streptomyces sp. SS1-1]
MTTANRFHLVPPRTWDSIFPPSRTYISGPGCHCRLDGSAGQGWEKCYVLGKESARARWRENRARITGDHPRATTTGRA